MKEKIAIFAFRIRFFLDKEPEVFRILLKHHIRIARMTKATKLTPFGVGIYSFKASGSKIQAKIQIVFILLGILLT